ncbi:hypothetical protein EJ04DRAFT_210665 [Polyplosphaeria fusca]|uniref:Uncharacterized protein n=1 Tax=Polyplosphaeria fusca TaxID=682080 RepID=A0A9P4RBG5_9PLEO|nr:hypothetical protein EJ04DRAFT_210665 [Polyplosphaeria fusca]
MSGWIKLCCMQSRHVVCQVLRVDARKFGTGKGIYINSGEGADWKRRTNFQDAPEGEKGKRRSVSQPLLSSPTIDSWAAPRGNGSNTVQVVGRGAVEGLWHGAELINRRVERNFTRCEAGQTQQGASVGFAVLPWMRRMSRPMGCAVAADVGDSLV